MTATPYCKKPYYPMLMSNGRDSLLLDYTGSCFTGRSGHSHTEQNQGTPCGWYKTANRTRHDIGVIKSLFAPGLYVNMFEAPAEPRMFEQEFTPQSAEFVTVLTFAADVKIRISSFLDSSSLWCQRVELTECPNDRRLDIGFSAAAPFSGCAALTLPLKSEFAAKSGTDGLCRFSYSFEGILGEGFMKCIPSDGVCADGTVIYRNVKAGFSAYRVISCTDNTEYDDYIAVLGRRLRLAEKSYDELYDAHAAEWKAYFSKFTVSLPNKEVQYLFDVSRYVVHSAQHPEYGTICLGNLPNLWGGGLNCSFDAWYAQQAILRCGDTKGSLDYINAYVRNMERGTKALEKINIPGTVYGSWDDCKGHFTRKDFERYITKYKPSFSGFAILAVYWQEVYHPGSVTPEMLEMVRRVAVFLCTVGVDVNGGNPKLKQISAGTEGNFMVEVDTLHQLLIGRSLEVAGALLGDAEYSDIGRKLAEGINVNMTEDGVLMPFRNAPYTGGLQFIFSLLMMPEKLDIRSIEAAIERGRTPWGINTEQTTEEYRHWPWNDTQAAICYAREKLCDNAMAHLMAQLNCTSSLGAIPEKIRLDGFVIGYWYTTVHAVYQWAVCDSLAYIYNGELSLAYGFDGSFCDFSTEHLVLPADILLSYTVKEGRLTHFKLENNSDKLQTLRLLLNPKYDGTILPENVAVQAHDKIEF